MSGRDVSARVEQTAGNGQVGRNEPPESAGDSLSEIKRGRKTGGRPAGPYLTRRRLDALDAQLSARDRAVLADVGRLHVVSGAQLRRLHYADSPAGRRLARLDLARLTSWRVLARLGRRVGGVRAGADGFVYGLDVAGQRLTSPPGRRARPPWTPGPAILAHALAVAELYVGLRELARRDGFRLAAFEAEPACWRRFTGPGGAPVVLKPDAYIRLRHHDYEDHAFIEVDRATASLRRIADKARSYVRYWASGREQHQRGVFPLVVWVVPDRHRQAQVTTTVAAIAGDHTDLFAAVTAAEAAPALAAGGLPLLVEARP